MGMSVSRTKTPIFRSSWRRAASVGAAARAWTSMTASPFSHESQSTAPVSPSAFA